MHFHPILSGVTIQKNDWKRIKMADAILHPYDPLRGRRGKRGYAILSGKNLPNESGNQSEEKSPLMSNPKLIVKALKQQLDQ